MSAIGFAVALLCIAHAVSVYGFVQFVEEKRCCTNETGPPLNGTFLTPLPRDSVTSLGNGSTISLRCYITCFLKSFETTVITRSCHDTCVSNNWPKLNDSSLAALRQGPRRRNESGDYVDETDGVEDADISMKNNSAGNETHCESILSSLNLYGANIVIFANLIYICPYVIVVIVFIFVPGLRSRAYDRAVLWYNVSQIAENCILIGLGASILCHSTLPPTVVSLLGLSIMFLTISSTLWLFVICIDMTLAITRLRRTPTRTTVSKTSTREAERKKFWIYLAVTWGGALVPTFFVLIIELTPLLPKSSPLRPHFPKLTAGANLAVIVYVALLPALTCLANTALFVYTTYKVIMIRRSTAIATKSCTAAGTAENNDGKCRLVKIREKYFLFLKLYLLMDAPWLTSALAAAFTDLWILKFLRMIQPMLMLCAILPPKTMSRVYVCCTAKANSTTVTQPS